MNKNDIMSNWNKMAIAYEEFTNSPNSYSNKIEWPAIKKLVPDLENKEIIDLGCGTGRFSFLTKSRVLLKFEELHNEELNKILNEILLKFWKKKLSKNQEKKYWNIYCKYIGK